MKLKRVTSAAGNGAVHWAPKERTVNMNQQSLQQKWVDEE
jgi:hypothetical protein